MAKKTKKKKKTTRVGKRANRTARNLRADHKTPQNYKCTTPDMPTDTQFISRCCMLWMNGVSDKAIAYTMGYGHTTFEHWLNKQDKQRTFTIDLWGEQQTTQCTFKELKSRMKMVFEPVYLTKLRALIKEAEEQGDLRTATKNTTWLMERVMPQKYGNKQQINLNQIPVKIKPPEGLDMDDL